MISENDFDAIYHEHKRLVYNMCLHYVLQAEDAQDITQEVFVKVHQNYEKYKPEAASLKTWICQIAINHCLDFIKAKKTKKRRGFLQSIFGGENEQSIDLPSDVNHPGIEAEDKEGLQKLMLQIQSLPEHQQTAIILTKIEGRPQQEVAEIMETSLKAVESLLQRAKKNLQKMIEESEGK